MPGPLVTQEVIDGIAVITLNRPEKMNALTGAMVQDLLSALEGAEVPSIADPAVGDQAGAVPEAADTGV